MSKAWMPLYIGDYLRDTQHLTCTQHGAYLLLIMHYWEHGGLPSDLCAVQKITRLEGSNWYRNKEAIASLFEPGWRHKRIDKELAKAQEVSDKRAVLGAIGGRHNRGLNNAQRRSRKLNGDARLPHREANAKAMVAHSHKEEEVSEKEFGMPKPKASIQITKELETIIAAKTKTDPRWKR